MSSDPRTLVELLERTCALHSSQPSLGRKVGSRFEWTSYGELHRLVAKLRHVLLRLGVGPEDRVAIVADSCVEWAALCYAVAGRGATFVPMYLAQTQAEWVHVLGDCGAKICFTGDAELLDRLKSVRSQLPKLERIISLEPSADVSECLSGLLEDCDPDLVGPLAPHPDQTAVIIYTSGTTGRSKGVMLSHGNIMANAQAAASLFPIGAADRTLSFLPWAHAFGQTVDLHLMLLCGVAVAINDSVGNLLTNLTLCRPTILVAVPRVFHRLHDNVLQQIHRRGGPAAALFDAGIRAATRQSGGQTLPIAERLVHALAERLLFRRVRERFGGCLRFAICGAAALRPEVREFVHALGIDLYEGYGLTEASPVVSVNAPGARKPGTVGRPLPGLTVTIDRTRLLDDSRGEVLVAGPSVMQGYWGLPLDSSQVLSRQGVLRTGDLGYLDSEGYLVISGRVKEQYKLENGKYIVPASIESRLCASPLIANCLVYGANRPYNVALVVPEPEVLAEHPDRGDAMRQAQRRIQQEVKKLCRELPSFERPKRICILEEDFSIENGLLTPTLKPKRGEIVRRFRSKLEALYDNPAELDPS